ncbi:unnamed protein product [Victoria cruziana]
MAIKAMALLSFGCLSVPAQPQKEGGLSGRRDNLKPIVVQGCPPTFVSAPGRRIVAVGDLHGDIAQARSALEMAGVLDPTDNNLWIGGETVLVQLGDVLDRGEDEIAILSLLRSLSIQAKQGGGAIFQINGNHESMNVEGDFRYVTPEGFDECIDFLEYLDGRDTNWENAFIGWARESEIWKEKRRKSRSHWSAFNLMKRQKGISARSFLFKPGGPLACELARNPVVLKIDDWVFCHGGLLPHHVVYGIERMNSEVSQWMSGNEDSEIPFVATRGYDSVVWNRLYSRDSEEIGYNYQQISVILQETLHAIGAKTIAVGHTPQLSGANCKYNDSVWRIDVGMSSGVLSKPPEVLEIVDNQPRVIKDRRVGPPDVDVADFV